MNGDMEGGERVTKTNTRQTQLGLLLRVFTSAPETKRILITRARPDLVSRKSTGVSGNYTCSAGLSHTQIRCEKKRKKETEWGWEAKTTTLALVPWQCDAVYCSS